MHCSTKCSLERTGDCFLFKQSRFSLERTGVPKMRSQHICSFLFDWILLYTQPRHQKGMGCHTVWFFSSLPLHMSCCMKNRSSRIPNLHLLRKLEGCSFLFDLILLNTQPLHVKVLGYCTVWFSPYLLHHKFCCRENMDSRNPNLHLLDKGKCYSLMFQKMVLNIWPLHVPARGGCRTVWFSSSPLHHKSCCMMSRSSSLPNLHQLNTSSAPDIEF